MGCDCLRLLFINVVLPYLIQIETNTVEYNKQTIWVTCINYCLQYFNLHNVLIVLLENSIIPTILSLSSVGD